jgi:hypothetical protein
MAVLKKAALFVVGNISVASNCGKITTGVFAFVSSYIVISLFNKNDRQIQGERR